MLRLARAVTVFLASGALWGCGAGGTAGISAGNEAKPLVAWEGDYVSWFDNGLDPIAVGVSLDGRPPGENPLLGDRTRSADFVGRVKVATMSQEANGEQVHVHLTVRPEREPLVDRGFGRGPVELFIAETSAAFGIVTGYENLVKSASFVLFARRFQGPEGPVLRWHLTAATDDVVKAVQEAATLQVMSE